MELVALLIGIFVGYFLAKWGQGDQKSFYCDLCEDEGCADCRTDMEWH